MSYCRLMHARYVQLRLCFMPRYDFCFRDFFIRVKSEAIIKKTRGVQMTMHSLTLGENVLLVSIFSGDRPSQVFYIRHLEIDRS